MDIGVGRKEIVKAHVMRTGMIGMTGSSRLGHYMTCRSISHIMSLQDLNGHIMTMPGRCHNMTSVDPVWAYYDLAAATGGRV